MTKWMIRNLKDFKTNSLGFYQNFMWKMGRRIPPKMILIFKQLEKYQNYHYPDNLNLISFSSHISFKLLTFPISSTKKESVIVLQMTNFLKKNMAIFHDVKEIDINFSYNIFASYVYLEGKYFKGYIEMELKTFFIKFEALFECPSHNF